MRALVVLTALLAPLSAAAQEGALDLLDGETLYQEGWLFTLGYEHERRSGLRHGTDRESDPLDREQTEQSLVASAHYGLRYDLQLSLIAPYVARSLRLDDPAGPDRLAAAGFGDMTAAAKWRFGRWSADNMTCNVSVIGGLDLPTGSDDESDHGDRLPPALQPGSGSWDPFIGVAATHEPYRWRFNAFMLYKINGQGGDDFSFGEEFFAEIAAGNRFWLEPYPGPFMRFDAMLRYRHAWHDRLGGNSLRDSGGDLVTFGATLAFRPRPVLDFQIAVEVPIYERVEGVQLSRDISVFFAFGYRI